MQATNFCGTGGSPAPMARGPSALGDSSSSCLDLEPSLLPIILRWSSSALLGMTPMSLSEQEMEDGEGVPPISWMGFLGAQQAGPGPLARFFWTPRPPTS